MEHFAADFLDAAILRAQPGDRLIVRVRGALTIERALHLRQSIEAQLPDDVEVWVMEEGLSIELERPRAHYRGTHSLPDGVEIWGGNA